MRTLLPRSPAWRPFLGQVALRGSVRLGDPDELTDENFDMAMNAPAAAIDFWSPMCAPCLQYKPVFEDAATQAPDGVLMATMNADYSKQTMDRYNVDSLPTTLYLVGGKEVNRTEGVQTKDTVLALVAKIAPAAQPTTPAPQPSQTAQPSQAAPSAPTSPAQTVVAPTATSTPTPASPRPSPMVPAAQAQIAPPAAAKPGISTGTLIAGGLGLFAVAGIVAYALSR